MQRSKTSGKQKKLVEGKLCLRRHLLKKLTFSFFLKSSFSEENDREPDILIQTSAIL